MYSKDSIIIDKVVCKKYPKTRYEFAIHHAKKADVIMDVGSGDGTMLYSLEERYKQFIGVDVSSKRIDAAKVTCSNMNVKFHNLEFDKGCNIANNSVDTILCLDVLDHMIDIRKAISEFHRLLSGKGNLILTVPNFARIDRRILLLLGRFPSTSTGNEGVHKIGEENLFDGGKMHYFTFRSLILLLKEVGFSNISSYGIGKAGRIYNLYPSLFSGSIALVCEK